MQKVKLPSHIDPIKSAAKRSDYDGVVATGQLERFLDLVVSCEPLANAHISFYVDELGLTVCKGTADVKCTVACQRCDCNLELQLHSEFCFTPARVDTDPPLLPEHYDYIELDDNGMIDIITLVEDELLISFPLVAGHGNDACSPDNSLLQFGSIEPEEEQSSPFKVLQQLKRDQE